MWINLIIVRFMWLVIGYWHLVISENIDIDLSVDRSNWENPLDPLSNYIKCNEDHVKQFVNCQYQLAKCSKSLVDKSVNMHHKVSDPTLKHIIRNILERLNVDILKVREVNCVAKVYINAADVQILRKYLNSEDDSITVREQIRAILEQFVLPEIVAERLSRSKFNSVDRCKTKNILSNLYKSFMGYFHFFSSQKDECLQYYEDTFVDPFYKISALDIISDVFSNFVLTPLGIFGHHFKVFIHEYYSDSTLVLIIVKTVVACIFYFTSSVDRKISSDVAARVGNIIQRLSIDPPGSAISSAHDQPYSVQPHVSINNMKEMRPGRYRSLSVGR
ncbi:unnamed protein product [Dracunculus medinensis]|uniref:Chloride channel CLIC-like protein 1 n=1 Tax=Dracunculus medinensis TaxID=318479 RepID=A0A0N4UF02_DRAME|nr:unnamed protein product [Dracunculus medinensis]